jgi:hypothetical protein
VRTIRVWAQPRRKPLIQARPGCKWVRFVNTGAGDGGFVWSKRWVAEESGPGFVRRSNRRPEPRRTKAVEAERWLRLVRAGIGFARSKGSEFRSQPGRWVRSAPGALASFGQRLGNWNWVCSARGRWVRSARTVPGLSEACRRKSIRILKERRKDYRSPTSRSSAWNLAG